MTPGSPLGCGRPDCDGDGHDARRYGGRDCNDEDPAVHPGIVEEEDWVIETLDSRRARFGETSIALGPDMVHISYIGDTELPLLRYARRSLPNDVDCDGEAW